MTGKRGESLFPITWCTIITASAYKSGNQISRDTEANLRIFSISSCRLQSRGQGFCESHSGASCTQGTDGLYVG